MNETKLQIVADAWTGFILRRRGVDVVLSPADVTEMSAALSALSEPGAIVGDSSDRDAPTISDALDAIEAKHSAFDAPVHEEDTYEPEETNGEESPFVPQKQSPPRIAFGKRDEFVESVNRIGGWKNLTSPERWETVEKAAVLGISVNRLGPLLGGSKSMISGWIYFRKKSNNETIENWREKLGQPRSISSNRQTNTKSLADD